MEEQKQITETPELPTVKKGQEYLLHAESAAFNGSCVARYNGMAVFITGCVPGDTVRALVIKKRKKHAEARTLEVVEPSPQRAKPSCDYFGTCGGCKWQNLQYEEQLRWKRIHVQDSFERLGGLPDIEVRPTLPCDRQLWYRNKMEFSFGAQRWLTEEEIASGIEFNKDFAVGLHIPGRYDKVLDVEKCWLQSELSNRILNFTRRFALENDLPSYNFRDHTGLLRNLVIRQSATSSETMVVLVTSDDLPILDRYGEALREEIPEVTTLLLGINRKKAQIAFSEETRLLYGTGTMTERLAGNNFVISPFSFFQTNTPQAERLYEEALKAADLNDNDTVWDLYCGAGTITLAAAKKTRQALGIELNEGAILDAHQSAERNDVRNVEFIAGDLKDVMAGKVEGSGSVTNVLEGQAERPDVIIIDPPRSGMHEDVVRTILEVAPERISYVSCNPTTQARDCALLAEKYHIEYVQPVDMFPQTYHIETVAKLVRK